jgi:hypothetical protein
MPRFYDEENPALNSFRKINAEVVRRRKNKYKDQEAVQLAPVSTGATFDDLRQRLVTLDVGLSDLRETVKLSASARSPSTVIDRFVSIASNLSGLVSNTRDFVVRKLKRNLNNFSSEEVAEIGGMVRALSQKLTDATSTLQSRLESAPSRALVNFNQESLNVLKLFDTGLTDLLQMLGDAVASYKQSGVGAGRRRIIKCGGQSPSLDSFPFNALPFSRLNDQMRPDYNRIPRYTDPTIEPRVRMPEIPDARFFRKIGGAEIYSHESVLKGGQGVASRKGMQFGFPQFLLGAHPPRNTQDLKNLPRRFL